ncbi:MAG: ATP-binding protein, partial [Lachnospiraceae bacterium]|nr:ATP-binding protein [Lachnospiraceae bacterium]
FIFTLSGQLNKYKLKAKEVETELRMQKVYSDSFKGMIDDIRMRQHEFNNHISMLHSLHLKYHTYEELADALDSYGDAVMKENRFYKLLSDGNSVIAGFLYGRFNEFYKKGVEVSYQVIVQELEIGVPCYKIVEILGDLMNNAVEALLADGERNKLHVSIIESDRFWIEVRNESPYISYKELGAFWEKGYSQKGEGRGLGLYNVKLICDEYGLEIVCDNAEIEGENWLSFTIRKEKETA